MFGINICSAEKSSQPYNCQMGSPIYSTVSAELLYSGCSD